MLTMKVLFGGYHKTANISRDPKRDGIISPNGTKGGVGNSPHFDFYGNSKIWQAPFCLFEETTILLPTFLLFWTFVIFFGCTKKPFEIAKVPLHDDVKLFCAMSN